MVQPISPIARLEALYAELPHIECKRLCRECCGPVVQGGGLTPLEFSRFADFTPSPVDPKDFMACTMLDGEHGTCRVYEMRPMICRLWGVVPSMRCPFGCVPDRWLTEAESRAFMARSREIGGDLVDRNPAAWALRKIMRLIAERDAAQH